MGHSLLIQIELSFGISIMSYCMITLISVKLESKTQESGGVGVAVQLQGAQTGG